MFTMDTLFTLILLSFYGVFLITCGIVSVIFIGMKAKTALLSGGMSGVIALVIAYLNKEPSSASMLAGLLLPAVLLLVFSWRSAKTLSRIFELIHTSSKDELVRKGIAFLIICLMAITSLVVFILQLISFTTLINNVG